MRSGYEITVRVLLLTPRCHMTFNIELLPAILSAGDRVNNVTRVVTASEGNLAPEPNCNRKRGAFRSSENQINVCSSPCDLVTNSLAENTVKVTSRSY